jgi:hypothetical protein
MLFMRKNLKYWVIPVLLGLFLNSCEGGFVDDSVTVTFQDNTGSSLEPKYVGYQRSGVAWIVCWENSPGASFSFKIRPGTYTFGLFTETSKDDVQAGGSGLYAQKTVTVSDAVTITFTVEDAKAP